MYLRSLTLRDFAGISSVSLPSFEDGLNVVVGDNEAGKSTLLTALRAAFFQKHRSTGEATKALAPYGRQVRPEIEVAFATGGVDYVLRKAFLQKPEAELSWAGGRLQGDAVEERLAEILRFSHSQARKPKEGEFVGTFGLLWVEQGRSTHGLDLGAGRDAVTNSLEVEVTQVLGGERGRSLIAASRARQDRFFTPTLRAKGDSPLKVVEERLDRLREELGQKQGALAEYRGKLQRLTDRRSVLRSYEKDDAVAVASAALAKAEQDQRALADLRRDVVDAERELKHALATRERAGERLRQRQELAIAADDARRRVEQERGRLADMQAALQRERRDLDGFEAAQTAARQALDMAEKRQEAARVEDERQRLVREAARLGEQVEEGRKIADRLEALRQDVPPIEIGRRDIAALEDLERECRDAEIRLSAGSPTIVFEPSEGGATIESAGRSIESGRSLTVPRRTTYHLSGFGTVTVEPSGGSIRLAEEARLGAERLRDRLSELRLGSVDDARRIAREGEERRTETTALEALLSARLPSGLAQAEAELRGMRETLKRHASPQGDDGAMDIDRAREEWRVAKDRAGEADAVLDASRNRFQSASAQLVRDEARVTHLGEEAQRLRADLMNAEAARTTAALTEDLAACELERSARDAVVLQRRSALVEGDPETVERTVGAKRRARDEIERTVGGLRAEIASLEGELRVQGATALDGEIARLQGEIETAERDRKRLSLEADASRLLHQTLLDAQREAHESWLAPIKAHVAPYLRLVHPDSDISLDETSLELTGLRRRGVDEEFRRLSAGAREQVAVVTRLALADVIKKGGHPATVILDDALVNTDERRLERMHHVLRKAAEGLQVIILTCRERDFRDIGAPIFRL